ncbi:hypothetical protein [Planomonospora sp. ID82291]|uniref:hypothetical protein n=1 Tax=Planomonospora sp. ID82291 TaxID=2738136 RepID=UPI0018C41ACA|nr:hypothetical protein [Planomonospora sp. ID82291]MBG0818331.1 hypothetical protein [Planomonospora sp. ID82291]
MTDSRDDQSLTRTASSDAVATDTDEASTETAAQRACPCGNPLPPPARRTDGTRHGGRTAKYCSATCRSRYRSARQAVQNAALAEATRRATSLQEQIGPHAERWTSLLATLNEQLEVIATTGTQRLADADTDATEALAAAAAAEERAEAAEAARREALAEARTAREARQEAERTAKRRAHEADAAEREAWRKVAEHEAARGQAEAEARAAEASRLRAEERAAVAAEEVQRLTLTTMQQDQRLTEREQALALALADAAHLREQLRQERERTAAADARADHAYADSLQARTEAGTAREELASLRRTHAEELGQLRGQLDQASERAAAATREASQAQTRTAVAEAQAASLREQLDEAKIRLAATEARTERLERRLSEDGDAGTS